MTPYFRIPLNDEELELIEDALRHYATSAAEPRASQARDLAEKIADADEKVGS
ncbi:MAG: hypothetical protein ACJ75S_06910 [Solirubrobacterales bacterium]|jgi:hypothetical protein